MASLIVASSKTFIKPTFFPKIPFPTFRRPFRFSPSLLSAKKMEIAVLGLLFKFRDERETAKYSGSSFSLVAHTPEGKLVLLSEPLKKSEASSGLGIPEVPAFGCLKFLLMSALFTLQTSEHALAGSDIATGMQPFSFFGDLGGISTGFASAFLLIFFSELGDKTFFIAALLAARNSAAVTFIGTFGALGAMTIISVIIGRTFHYVDDILPFRFGDTDLPIDDLAAVCLLVYFGVSSLIEASSNDAPKAEEEQKEAELAVSELSATGAGILAAASTTFSTFLLVFVAEWGDKSFFSTIALAAASSPLGVIAGALAGHAVATLLAVVGGSFLGTYLSEKVVLCSLYLLRLP